MATKNMSQRAGTTGALRRDTERSTAQTGDSTPRLTVSGGTATEGTSGAAQASPRTATCAEKLGKRKVASRGITAEFSTWELHHAHRLRSLLMLQRFRVIRTIDVAVTCFAERPFKAALTAAQRVTRALVKEALIRRYKTERFQTVYGLTARGAAWLEAQGHDATASIRRVSDMTNPEHRLWLQFIVLCCEARGLTALVMPPRIH